MTVPVRADSDPVACVLQVLQDNRGGTEAESPRDRGQSEAGQGAMTQVLHWWDILSAGFRVHVRITKCILQNPSGTLTQKTHL